MGGPNGAASTENMNGDAKPTNSKVRKPHKCLIKGLINLSN